MNNFELEQELTQVYIHSVNIVFVMLNSQIKFYGVDSSDICDVLSSLSFKEFYSISNLLYMCSIIDGLNGVTRLEATVADIVMLASEPTDIVEPLDYYTRMLGCVYLGARKDYNCSIGLLS